jgi:hypothetical protein
VAERNSPCVQLFADHLQRLTGFGFMPVSFQWIAGSDFSQYRRFYSQWL